MHETVWRNLQSSPGSYVLVAYVAEPRRIAIGRLGEFAFEVGYYLYVGSAMAGLRCRLVRHLRDKKRLHWHIDYLLQHARLYEIWCASSSERRECAWASALNAVAVLQRFPAPFGASDCRCATHLFYTKERPPASILASALPADPDLTVISML